MKKIVATGMIAALVAVTAAPAAHSAEATVGIDAASAYVFRGVTLNDGFVLQPYLEVSGLPVDIGVWGNFDLDDYDGALDKNEFSEIDLYVSYSLPIEELDVSLTYTEYTYPGGPYEPDREVSLSLGLPIVIAPYVSANYGLDGGIKKDWYFEAGLGYELELAENLTLSLGAAIGYLLPDEGDDGFHQYELSASLTYDFITLGVTYYGQADDKILVDVKDGGGYDVDLVVTLGLSYSF